MVIVVDWVGLVVWEDICVYIGFNNVWFMGILNVHDKVLVKARRIVKFRIVASLMADWWPLDSRSLCTESGITSVSMG